MIPTNNCVESLDCDIGGKAIWTLIQSPLTPKTQTHKHTFPPSFGRPAVQLLFLSW